jgi:DeoR/GlpR family transcriptional regulator of sugar metabolism
MVRLGPISEVDMLFTDRPPPEAMAELLVQAEVQVFVA